MQIDLLVESGIGAQVETKPGAFPLVVADPVEPGPDLIISDILVPGANKP